MWTSIQLMPVWSSFHKWVLYLSQLHVLSSTLYTVVHALTAVQQKLCLCVTHPGGGSAFSPPTTNSIGAYEYDDCTFWYDPHQQPSGAIQAYCNYTLQCVQRDQKFLRWKFNEFTCITIIFGKQHCKCTGKLISGTRVHLSDVTLHCKMKKSLQYYIMDIAMT